MSDANHDRNIFSYETLVHAISGAAGSVVAMATFFPLDTVRSRLQLEEDRKSKNTLATMHELVAKEGPYTLYRGMIPVLQSLCASNFVYFYTFHGLKKLRSKSSQTAGNDLLIASIAGVINVLTTTPLWVVNTRLKMRGINPIQERNNNEYNTLLDGLMHIRRTEGLSKLWAGTLPSLMLVLNPAIQFMTYEAIKRRVIASLHGAHPPAWLYFAIGAIAKTIATTLTYPLQLVQTKLRHGHKDPNLPPDAGCLQILFYILKKQGIAGMYKGMEAKLLQTVLTAALMFLAYEKISRFVLPRILANLRKNHFRLHFHRQSNSSSLISRARKLNAKWNDKLDKHVDTDGQQKLTLNKIERKTTKAILRFWNKLKPRKNAKKKLETARSASPASVWNPSHVESMMSARSQRGITDTTNKRLRSPRVNLKKRAVKQHITYDYDAAISQPDVPNFLNNKLGRSVVVSGMLRKKKAVKIRGIKGKNFQKRPRPVRKPMVQKSSNTRLLDAKNAKDTIVSCTISEQKKDVGEKENITNNGIINIGDLSNLLRNPTVNGRSVSYKDGTKEQSADAKENQTVEETAKNRAGECAMTKLETIRGSRIPRKMVVFPVQTIHEFYPEKKLVNARVKDSETSKCVVANNDGLENVEIAKDDEKNISPVRQEANSGRRDVVRFEEFVNDPKIDSTEEKTSTLDADEEAEDCGLTSTDESPAIISNFDDPRVLTILRSLKLACPCKSCTDHEQPASADRQDNESDSKNLTRDEIKKKKWSHKQRKYIYTSSEEMNASSDGTSEGSRKKRKSRTKAKSILSHRVKTNSIVHAAPKVSNRRRSNFSFFNTLFDIVFWPYLFLKTNR